MPPAHNPAQGKYQHRPARRQIGGGSGNSTRNQAYLELPTYANLATMIQLPRLSGFIITAFFAVSSLPTSLWGQATIPWHALPQGIQYDGQIPTPEQFFAGDFQIGNRHLDHQQLLDYLRAVDNASPRVSLETYAHSYGGRPLVVAIVTSPQNQTQLNELAAAISLDRSARATSCCSPRAGGLSGLLCSWQRGQRGECCSPRSLSPGGRTRR